MALFRWSVPDLGIVGARSLSAGGGEAMLARLSARSKGVSTYLLYAGSVATHATALRGLLANLGAAAMWTMGQTTLVRCRFRAIPTRFPHWTTSRNAAYAPVSAGRLEMRMPQG